MPDAVSPPRTDIRRGLSAAQAAARLASDGPNVLPAPRPPHPALLFVREMTHFFAVLLWVASGLAVLAGVAHLAVAIAVVVVVNAVFAFVQEYRADLAAQRLRDLLPAKVTVRRDGNRVVVAAPDLVVGDVVLLEAGDRVSADLELVDVHDLALNESMLTGESVPVRRPPGGQAYAGTLVVEGEADAVVVATGSTTRLAGIAALTRTGRRPPSPLARQLQRVVKGIAAVAVGVGTSLFGLSVLLGMPVAQGFLFGVGVTVALVPEGLLPTVTLSLARAAQRMAARNALVRRLESVETLGAATFICTDKTGTLTRNEMTVIEVWTPQGIARVEGGGYTPQGQLVGDPAAVAAARDVALTAVRASTGRLVSADGDHRPVGDPMEVALHVLALRARVDVDGREHETPTTRRFPFDPRRRRASVVAGSELHLKGAPDSVLPLCATVPGAAESLAAMSVRGLRVLAVARRKIEDAAAGLRAEEAENGLDLLGLVALEDPPREDVPEALSTCRQAGIRVAMITGDHPATARAIATEIGLLIPGAPVLQGSDLPSDDAALGALLDRDGVVIARVAPEDKLRIASELRTRGHVVAMTGDGVNDGPALREADIGIAMGASGTDVAREAADLVLLDDHFATIVGAVELGRATYANIRRFLTYHLTDNVAELTPFAVWALTGGNIPLALSVLQILALDIGTDILPALALGAEPPNPRTLRGPSRTGALIDASLLRRVFGVLGPAEATAEMAAFLTVLMLGGWAWADNPPTALLAQASGAAFTAVVLGQLACAFACRSETRWVAALRWNSNPFLLWAVAAEVAVLLCFLTVPPFPNTLGGTFPTPAGWAVAASAIPAIVVADTANKALRSARRNTCLGSGGLTFPGDTGNAKPSSAVFSCRPRCRFAHLHRSLGLPFSGFFARLHSRESRDS